MRDFTLLAPLMLGLVLPELVSAVSITLPVTLAMVDLLTHGPPLLITPLLSMSVLSTLSPMSMARPCTLLSQSFTEVLFMITPMLATVPHTHMARTCALHTTPLPCMITTDTTMMTSGLPTPTVSTTPSTTSLMITQRITAHLATVPATTPPLTTTRTITTVESALTITTTTSIFLTTP